VLRCLNPAHAWVHAGSEAQHGRRGPGLDEVRPDDLADQAERALEAAGALHPGEHQPAARRRQPASGRPLGTPSDDAGGHRPAVQEDLGGRGGSEGVDDVDGVPRELHDEPRQPTATTGAAQTQCSWGTFPVCVTRWSVPSVALIVLRNWPWHTRFGVLMLPTHASRALRLSAAIEATKRSKLRIPRTASPWVPWTKRAVRKRPTPARCGATGRPTDLGALLLPGAARPDDVRLLAGVREPQEPAVLALPLLRGVEDGVAVDPLLAEARLGRGARPRRQLGHLHRGLSQRGKEGGGKRGGKGRGAAGGGSGGRPRKRRFWAGTGAGLQAAGPEPPAATRAPSRTGHIPRAV